MYGTGDVYVCNFRNDVTVRRTRADDGETIVRRPDGAS